MKEAWCCSRGAVELFFLFSGLWLASIGSVYSYPLWTSELQSIHNLSQSVTGSLGVTMYSTQVAATVVPFLFSLSSSPLLFQLLLSVWLPSSLAWSFLSLASSSPPPLPAGATLPLLFLGVAFLGIASGSLFIPVVSLAMKMLPNRSLFVSAYYALCYGVGATSASFALVWTSSLSSFFWGVLAASASIGLISSFVIWKTVSAAAAAESSAKTEESKMLVQAEDVIMVPPPPPPPSLKDLFFIFVGSARSWLVILILIFNIGIGSTFAANMERFVSLGSDSRFDLELKLLAAFFNVAQTVGRVVAVIVGSRGELTLLVVLCVSFGYVLLLTLASVLDKGAFIISLVFGVFYGGMRSTIASILFSSSIQDRRLFLTLALFTFPVAAVGPLGLNFLVGFFFERYGDFHWAFVTLAIVGGASGILTIILWRLQPSKQVVQF